MPRLRPTLEFRRGDELRTSVLVESAAHWFQGHFPAMPLMPGVGMLALVEESIELFWGTTTELPARVGGFRRVRFRQRVDPGSTLRILVHKVHATSLRFSVDVKGQPACTGECSIAAAEETRAETRVETRTETRSETRTGTHVVPLDAPWSACAGRAFSSDGLSFAAIASRAAQLTRTLSTAERSRVCVACEDRAEVAAALLAAFASGIELILPPALSAEALADTYRARRFSHWLGPAEWSVPTEVAATRVAEAWPAVDQHDVHVTATNACVFLQTGGSTGQPQLWAKTATNLLAEVAFHAHALQVDGGDHILATAAPHHIYGLLFSVLLPLVSKATVERTSPFFPQEIAHRIESSGATILVSTPAHLRALASCMTSGHRLRLVLSSGAPLSAADSADFHARTGVWPLEIYGSTETGGVAVRRQDDADAPWLPLPSVDVCIDGETLCVRSPFVSRVPRDDEFFVTADRAELLPDGTFRLLGRVDGVVKVGGKRVALPEVENALRALDGVSDAAVLALPSSSGRGQDIVALAASSRSPGDLARELREKLPSPAWPRRLRCVPAIPITSVGKRDRAAILQLLATPAVDEP